MKEYLYREKHTQSDGVKTLNIKPNMYYRLVYPTSRL